MPSLAVVAWLAAVGALPAWYDIVVHYLVPLYSRLGRPDRWTFYRWHVWLPIAAGVALSLGSALAGRRFSTRHAVVTVGLGYGVAHFFGQGKGWEYHLYPLAAFAAVALFAEMQRLRRSEPRGRAAPARVYRRGRDACSGSRASRRPTPRGSRQRSAGSARSWRTSTVGSRRRISCRCWTPAEAGVHALLRLRAVQPTRFIYDFHFYHDVQTPTIQRLREELLVGFDAHPPKFVVLFERGWPAGGYERVDGFAGLRLRLSAYRVDRRGDGYLVYAR